MKPNLLRRTFAFVFIVVQVFAAHDGLLAQAPVFPKGTNLTSLTVIHENNLGNDSQKFLMATLQGLVARRSSSQIYIENNGSYGRWKNHLRDNYGIPYTTTSSVGYWTMVRDFAPLISGRYILYNRTNASSISVANSLSGPLDAVAVDASIELSAKVLGGLNNKILDVSARDEAWAWTNYYSSFNRSNVVEQEEWIAFNLRDYAAMANAFTFFDGNSTFRSNVLSAMDPDTACIGWGDGSLGEDQFVSRSSSNGVFTVPANFALNLSTLSSVRDPFLVQRTYTFPTPETNVHYVTFIATDGDNVQWDVGGYDGYFSQPQRGSFNMGWTIAPTLPDLAPSVMRWFYENSSNGPSRDFFVCGTSGAGYMYPSMYPSAELPLHVQKLNNLMARADLNISEILDFNSVSRIDLWNQYLAQPAIDALYYLDYSPYHGAKGAVYFSTNGKPVIACRESLWADLEEDSTLIANINAASRDPSSPLGYSMVAVHVWSKNLANVQNVVTNLASDVRVVTPDAFAKLIQQNVGRRLSFDFANGLQGWTTNRTKASDKAQWTSAEGGGALMLDGSDTTPDTTRNSWCIRSIILPPNATTLSFDTRATGDGRLRVRIKDVITPNPPLTVLLDWDTPTTTNWVNRTVSLASYAGQTITFYFDQTDGGPDTNNARFVDNIAILTDGPALYAPATPRLFTPVADLTNGVNLTWRNNDTLAEEFRIERRLASGGVWSEVGSVSGTVTNFSDASMFWGTNYLYRVRGSNASGLGATSNERDVVPPLKPSLTILNQTNSITLSWPAWATNYFLSSSTNLTVWTAVAGSSTNQNGSNFMTVPQDQSLRFFRLMAQ